MTVRRANRYIVKPLIDVNGKWLHHESVYPDLVRIPMANGHVGRYFEEVKQPPPVLADPKREGNWEVGYSHKETLRKKVRKWVLKKVEK